MDRFDNFAFSFELFIWSFLSKNVNFLAEICTNSSWQRHQCHVEVLVWWYILFTCVVEILLDCVMTLMSTVLCTLYCLMLAPTHFVFAFCFFLNKYIFLFFFSFVCLFVWFLKTGEIFDFEVFPFEGGTHSVIYRWDYDDGMRFTTLSAVHQYVYRNAGM